MSSFEGLFKTIVNVVTLPVAVAVDILEIPKNAANGDMPGTTTARHLDASRMICWIDT